MRARLLLAALAAACSTTPESETQKTTERDRPPLVPQTVQEGSLVRTARQAGFQSMVEEFSKVDIVYLGESHTNPEHHAIQLRVIKALYEKGRLHAIGMEMFQRPYQGVLDAYVEGRIREAELVERTEYKKRWGYDFELYAPILRFARTNRLPVIALNVSREIRKKVSQGGLASLSNEDRLKIPAVDTGDAEHRAYLEGIFKAHYPDPSKVDKARMERFYEVQCLWEDVMADSVVRWFATAPKDGQIAVLAGSGHVANRYGIPARAHRRGNRSYRTLVCVSAGKKPPGHEVYGRRYADWIWVTKADPPFKFKMPPKPSKK